MTIPIWILLIAAGLDLFLPEPPTALHPVGWMGNWIGAGAGQFRNRFQ